MLDKNPCDLHEHNLIWLKLEMLFSGPKAILLIKFGANLIIISGVIGNFVDKTILNVCHVFRLIRCEGQVEDRYAARLSIREVSFDG